MNLSKVSSEELLSRLDRLTKSERKITHLILWHILEVDHRKLYLKLNYDSLYKYLTKHLGYSESAAYDRIQAMRLLKQVPSVANKIEDGSLNLTQLVKVEQSLKQEKRLGKELCHEQVTDLLTKMENKTTFETEKIIACELNQTPKAYQKVKPQSDESIRLELTLSEEQYEILKKAQSYISHIIPENNIAAVITYLAKSLIQKKEGAPQRMEEVTDKGTKPDRDKSVTPAKKSKSKIQKKADTLATQGFRVMPETPINPNRKYLRPNTRKYIPVKVRRQVYKNANYCCEYSHPESKTKCSSKYQLEVDHIIPVVRGGSNEIKNLRLLCGIHNRKEALRWGLTRP